MRPIAVYKGTTVGDLFVALHLVPPGAAAARPGGGLAWRLSKPGT